MSFFTHGTTGYVPAEDCKGYVITDHRDVEHLTEVYQNNWRKFNRNLPIIYCRSGKWYVHVELLACVGHFYYTPFTPETTVTHVTKVKNKVDKLAAKPTKTVLEVLPIDIIGHDTSGFDL